MSTKMTHAFIIATILGSSSAGMASDTAVIHAAQGGRCAIQTACLPWQAPVGHRQPSAADLPDNFTPVPSDLELEALDKAIDQKLTICRGC
jgi:hypothetical protein